MAELLFKDEVYKIISAAIEVHRELGHGFAEAVYQEAMQIELASQQIHFEPLRILRISYKGHLRVKAYIADLICFNEIIVELKAINELSGNEQSQVLNYLKATGFRVGLLINFGKPGRLDWQRLVR